jgi:CubicO group peptidase (beta-lactamase class C family)
MTEVFPAGDWDDGPASSVHDAQLEAALAHARRRGAHAMMVVVGGRVAASFGDVSEKLEVASARKSLLSALYGIYAAEGLVDISATLADLGIDDAEPLDDVEKQATIRDLLMSRSGVYRPAAAESRNMARGRPAPNSHQPGTHWNYNNWDFNVLGTIFERQIWASVHEVFEERVARPIGMQDYTSDDGYYLSIDESTHRAYRFKMSARDLARFGLLFARDGRWRDDQIVPSDWVKESTTPHTADAQHQLGFGYSWWSGEPRHLGGHDFYLARGGAGHAVLVVPALDLVVVHRVVPDPRVRDSYWRGWYGWRRIGPRSTRLLPPTTLNRVVNAVTRQPTPSRSA